MRNEIPFDLITRKKGNEYILLHPGTGLHTKGSDLNAMYVEMENKKKQYLADVESIGATELLHETMAANTAGSPVRVQQSGGYKSFFIKLAIIVFILALVLQILVSKVDQELKTLEVKVRQNLESPTAAQTEERLTKLRASLKRAEPYLIEMKSHWHKLPNKTSE